MSDDAGDRLRLLLQRAQLTPEQLAGKLNRAANEIGLAARIDRKTPYKWLRNGTPRSPWPALTAAVLTEQLGTPITAGDIGWSSPTNELQFVSAASGLDVPWTAAGTVRAVIEVSETSAMDRRIFLHISGAALTQPALEWLLAQPSHDAVSTIGRRVQDSHVDSLNEMAAHLRRMDDQFGGGAVLDLVKGQIRFVIDLLREHQYTSAVGARLHGTAGELMRLGGWLSFDAGQHAQAQRFWVAALHSANTAGDRALGANILGFMSCQAKDLQLYGEATRLADAGRQGHQGASHRVSAILALRVAEARAQTGEADQTRAAIDDAFSAMQSTPPESGDPAWSYWLDDAQVHAQAGYCYTRLEDWTRAQHHLTTALRLQADSYSREGALRLALLATTYARQGDPEHACHIANQAVDILAQDVDSDRCIGHIRRVEGALRPYQRVAAVGELSDRVDQVFGVAA